jgi:aryl sulfotransferase
VSEPRTVWLASYPKSGNTWVRAMLAALTAEDPTAELDVNSLGSGPIPSSRPQLESFLGFASSDLTQVELELLRPLCDAALDCALDELLFRKVHDSLYGTLGSPIVPPERTRGAVYLARDPRDVAVSWAHHSAESHEWAVAALADPGRALDESLTDLEPQTRQLLGTWSDHVTAWIDHDLFPVLTVRYEDIAADPIAELRRIACFAGLEPSDELLTAASRGASFERLRANEDREGFVERPGRDRPFFRRGVAGGWRDELDPELARRVERDHAVVMRRLGYV